MSEANFPQFPLPLPQNKYGSYNTRQFKVGEPVLIRFLARPPPYFPKNFDMSRATYLGSDIPPRNADTPNRADRTRSHKVRYTMPNGETVDLYVHWYSVGKIPQTVSKTAVNLIAKNKGVPTNVGNYLKKFGGRRRTQRRRSRKN